MWKSVDWGLNTPHSSEDFFTGLERKTGTGSVPVLPGVQTTNGLDGNAGWYSNSGVSSREFQSNLLNRTTQNILKRKSGVKHSGGRAEGLQIKPEATLGY